MDKGPLNEAEALSLASRLDLSLVHGSAIAVTGSSGMIGNYFIQAICRVAEIQGYRPRRILLVNRSDNGKTQDWTKSYGFVERRKMALDFSMELPPVDFFCHLASPASPTSFVDPNEIWLANLGPAISLFSSPTPPNRTLFVSSGEVYGGDSVSPLKENQPLKFQWLGSRSWYPNAKIMTERTFEYLAGEGLGAVTTARLFHTFGPGVRKNDGRSFADFLWAAAQKLPVKLYSNGFQRRTFGYIEDSVAGLYLAMTGPPHVGCVNVGGLEEWSIIDFAKTVSRLAKVPLEVSAQEERGNRVESQTKSATPDLTLLQNLGWSAEVSIKEGIERTLRYIGGIVKI